MFLGCRANRAERVHKVLVVFLFFFGGRGFGPYRASRVYAVFGF